MLVITTLHNGMILSTLSISSRGFTFGFPKRLHTNGDVFLIYKLVIILLISQRGTPFQQPSPRTKYTIEPPLRPMEPSNSLPLIEAQLLLRSPQTTSPYVMSHIGWGGEQNTLYKDVETFL